MQPLSVQGCAVVRRCAHGGSGCSATATARPTGHAACVPACGGLQQHSLGAQMTSAKAALQKAGRSVAAARGATAPTPGPAAHLRSPIRGALCRSAAEEAEAAAALLRRVASSTLPPHQTLMRLLCLAPAALCAACGVADGAGGGRSSGTPPLGAARAAQRSSERNTRHMHARHGEEHLASLSRPAHLSPPPPSSIPSALYHRRHPSVGRTQLRATSCPSSARTAARARARATDTRALGSPQGPKHLRAPQRA